VTSTVEMDKDGDSSVLPYVQRVVKNSKMFDILLGLASNSIQVLIVYRFDRKCVTTSRKFLNWQYLFLCFDNFIYFVAYCCI